MSPKDLEPPTARGNFLEYVTGFLFQPRAVSGEFFARIQAQKRGRLLSWNTLLTQFIGIFTGFVLIFYFFYPEVFFIPSSLTSGPPLFIFGVANPVYMVGGFLLGYIALAFFSPYLSSGLNFFILRALGERPASVKSSDQSKNSRTLAQNPLKFSDYVCAYSFSFLPLGVFDVFTVFWIYFNEKFLFSKIYFPVTDITLAILILMVMAGITLLWKFWIELRINQAYFPVSNRASLVPILIKVAILAILLGVVAALTNSIAGQFA